MPTLADQLRKALDEEGASQRGLAVRLAKRTGTEMESERRWIRKVLKGEVKNPERESLDALEDELGKPRGYFKVPTRAQRREAEATEMDAFRSRLAELEDALNALGPELLDLSDLARRVRLLEQRGTTRTRTSGTKP